MAGIWGHVNNIVVWWQLCVVATLWGFVRFVSLFCSRLWLECLMLTMSTVIGWWGENMEWRTAREGRHTHTCTHKFTLYPIPQGTSLMWLYAKTTALTNSQVLTQSQIQISPIRCLHLYIYISCTSTFTSTCSNCVCMLVFIMIVVFMSVSHWQLNR